MMRIPLSKKVRFEVFKRDSFTCQYCGLSAPDVILHTDHIDPVANGGENEITNLITSCIDCNLGKGPRTLDDDSIIAKQKQQLDELNERRNQLEMMMDWRTGLKRIEADQIAAIQQVLQKDWHFSANETGQQSLRKWIKKYGFQAVLENLDTSFNQYIRYEDDSPTSESWNKAFNMIPRIISVKARGADSPEDMRLYYIRGILRNRVAVNEKYVMQLLRAVKDAGANFDQIEVIAKTCHTWSAFRQPLENYLEDCGGGNG
jgi:hypothetical protein